MTKEIKPLTSLRFFLAMWVVCRHVFVVFWGQQQSLLNFTFPHGMKFIVSGFLGVDGFFVLSGFILAYNYAGKFDEPSLLKYQDFLAARLARVYPVHLATLFGMLLLAVFFRDVKFEGYNSDADYSRYTFVLNLFLVQSWYLFHDTSWNDVSWSISAEWFAYLCFPIALYAAGKSQAASGIIFRFVVSIAVLLTVELHSPAGLSLPGGLIRIIPEFIMGIVLYRYFVHRGRGNEPIPSYSGCLSLALAIAGIAMSINTLVVSGLALLILSLAFETDILTPVGSKPYLVYLGKISFCLYMVQRIAEKSFLLVRLHALQDWNRYSQAAVYFLFLFALAAFFYHFIEEPSRAWLKQRLSAAGRGKAAVSAA